jgi:hypothetical protein
MIMKKRPIASSAAMDTHLDDLIARGEAAMGELRELADDMRRHAGSVRDQRRASAARELVIPSRK